MLLQNLGYLFILTLLAALEAPTYARPIPGKAISQRAGFKLPKLPTAGLKLPKLPTLPKLSKPAAPPPAKPAPPPPAKPAPPPPAKPAPPPPAKPAPPPPAKPAPPPPAKPAAPPPGKPSPKPEPPTKSKSGSPTKSSSQSASACPIPSKGLSPAKQKAAVRRWLFGDELPEATPRNVNDTISERSLEKRTDACGINIRDQDLAVTGCDANAVSYVLQNGNSVVRTPFANTNNAKAPNMNCDHIVELQVLARTMEAAQACKAVDAILKEGFGTAGVAQPKQQLFGQLLTIINSRPNSFYLNTQVNSPTKSGVVSQFIGRATVPNVNIAAGGLNDALRSYFGDQTINQSSRNVAAQLDGGVTTFLNNAVTRANAALDDKLRNSPACDVNVRLQNEVAEARQRITRARALFNGNAPTVVNVWNSILNI